MIKYELSWKAPEGKTAKAELDDLRVDGNAPVECNTWWAAALLAAKIAFENESFTERVTAAAERLDDELALRPVEVNGWVFSARDVQYSA